MTTTRYRDELASIRRFDQLIAFLRDRMDWPIDGDDFEESAFDYTAEELGIDSKNAAKIREIKRMRPLAANQPWGIFFIRFEPKQLPVVALRRILSQVTLKKRVSANRAERQAWAVDDLLFISNYGVDESRQISFAHFAPPLNGRDLPTLKVLGWKDSNTALHLDAVAAELTERLAWPADEDDVESWRTQWRSAFTLGHREAIASAQKLAVRLAALAGAIRGRVRSVLAIESARGQVTRLMKAFREALLDDLSADDFADMYAQTIAYGLLSTRIADPRRATAGDLAGHVHTSPFLRDLLDTFLKVGGRKSGADGTGIDFDELGTSEVVEMIDSANMEAVMRDFGDRNPREDPVIHFYELFLKEYDPRKRMQRGVFYTPRPVVGYIVRSLDALLRTEFGLAVGLADTTTWAQMANRFADLTIPDGVPPDQDFVRILDPATGTGTFLVEVIDVIYATLKAKWQSHGHSESEVDDLWNEYVPRHLLTRLHGYEILMAPYAIAHLKIGLKLHETGYRFASDKRARIYLTNTLEPPHKQLRLPEVDALAHEAVAVDAAKRNAGYTVVLGNPPYAGHSANNGKWIRDLLRSGGSQSYFEVDGAPLKERNSKWLNDDYVKFLRFAQWTIDRSGHGVIGFITNHSYLDNPTFRGMRESLIDSFPRMFLLDLHGNAKKKERAPDGGKDENVFDIQQGVAVGLLAKSVKRHKSECRHGDLWGQPEPGTRAAKYAMLGSNDVMSNDWDILNPRPPSCLFIPRDEALLAEYEAGWKLTDIFPLHGVGMTTARDHVVIDFDRQPLLDRATVFRDSTESDAALCARLGIPIKKGWNIARARKLIQEEEDLDRLIRPVLYRPFDERWIFYHDSLVWRTVKKVMQHMTGQLPQSRDYYNPSVPRQLERLGHQRDHRPQGARGLRHQHDVPTLRHRSDLGTAGGGRSVQSRTRNNDDSGFQDDAEQQRRLLRLSALLLPNVALISCRQQSQAGATWAHCGVARVVVESCALSNKTREISTIMPLYLHPADSEEPMDQNRRPNLRPEFVRAFASAVGLRFIPDGVGDRKRTFGPEDIFHFVYAILHSPQYRRRYADFLRSDYARVPLPGSRALFAELVPVGARLVELHLMEHHADPAADGVESAPQAENAGATFLIGDGDNVVEKVRYSRTTGDTTGRVWINEAQYFDNVSPEIYQLMFGGYVPAEKWLKDRRGRRLSSEDVAHYRAMIDALTETVHLMAEIDAIIDKHGGWPAAFQSAEPEAPRIVPFRPPTVEPSIEQRYDDCVPLVSMEAAAGGFGDPQDMMNTIEQYENGEWVTVDSRHRLRRGMFVAQVVGRSMEPDIPDGSWCLFRAPVEGTRQGKTVLVELRGDPDPDTGERYTVKRYTSEKVEGDPDGDWRHTRITLSPTNPDYKPIILTAQEDEALRVIAEFLEVVGGDR